MSPRCASTLGVCVVCLAGLGGAPQGVRGGGASQWASGPPAEPSPAASPERVAQLIEELGAEQYVRRERAQEELRRLGMEAFDALWEAQQHEDIEIALRARYLLRSLPVPWTEETDPPVVKQLLRGYENGNREERRRRMEQLASLDDLQGVAPLCRLVRFEADRVLSKEAAIRMLHRAFQEECPQRPQLAALIRKSIGRSARPAAAWLATFARTLEDPDSTLVEWERISGAEEAVLRKSPEETDRRIVRDLLRWRVELLLDRSRSEEALQVAQQTLRWLEEDRQELLEMVDWSIRHSLWSLADAVAARFPEAFARDPLLMYRAAEVQRKSGRRELAEETARRALEREPDRHEQHLETAGQLRDRLLYEWAERELRRVMEATRPQDEAGLEARLLLANMLFDLGRELASAEILQATVEALDRDKAAAASLGVTADRVRAWMHYRFAMHYGRQGDRQRQRQHLEQALRHQPNDVDVLIASYRLGGDDPSWHAMAAARIREVATRLRETARQYEEIHKNPAYPRMQPDPLTQLASAHNEFAWLVSNTEGDLQEALRSGQRALELSPDNAAYLDTLGRCYYALGDLPNAVKYQARAARLEPWTQQIRRQLELFQQELEASRGRGRGAAPKGGQAPDGS